MGTVSRFERWREGPCARRGNGIALREVARRPGRPRWERYFASRGCGRARAPGVGTVLRFERWRGDLGARGGNGISLREVAGGPGRQGWERYSASRGCLLAKTTSPRRIPFPGRRATPLQTEYRSQRSAESHPNAYVRALRASHEGKRRISVYRRTIRSSPPEEFDADRLDSAIQIRWNHSRGDAMCLHNHLQPKHQPCWHDSPCQLAYMAPRISRHRPRNP